MPVIITKSKDEVNEGPIEKLPKTKNKNGFDYTMVKRNRKAVIYVQVNPEFPNVKGFEVSLISLTKPCAIQQKNGSKAGMWYQYPRTEKFPGNEDFGKTAWSYCTLEQAEKKFEELSK
jgi:hypothetical protein